MRFINEGIMKFINGRAKWVLALFLVAAAAAAGFGLRAGLREERQESVQRASYRSSIQVPGDGDQSMSSETNEHEAALQSLARVSPDQAREAALARVPGTAKQIELENEGGNLVYTVEVATNRGEQAVVVDAGDARVLHVGGEEEDD